MFNEVRKIDAMLTHFMHIERPDLLPDEVWIEKFRQLQYLFESNMLPIHPKKPGK